MVSSFNHDRKKSKNPLIWKMIACILLFSSIFTCIVTMIQLSMNYIKDMNQVHQTLDLIKKSYIEPVSQSVWTYDTDQINIQLSGILNMPYIHRIELYNQNKDHVKSMGEDKSDHDILRQLTLTYHEKNDTPSIVVGSLKIFASLEQVYQRLFDNIIVILISQTIKTFCVSIFIFMIVHYLITRHLITIADYANQLNSRRLDKVLNLNREQSKHASPDELDHVVAAINFMREGLLQEVSRLKQTKKKISEALTRENKLNTQLLEIKNNLEKRVEERTQEAFTASQAKSEFLANMSHEIRTPIHAIISLTFLALKTDLTYKHHEYLHKIESASQSLLNIVDGILDFSKIEAGKLTLENIPFSIAEVLKDIHNIFTIKAKQSGIPLSFEMDKNIPDKVLGDPYRLSQILINLTSNAYKFTQKGQITIQFKRLNNISHNKVLLKISVIDTGIGLKSDEIDKLFKPFSQTDSSITRKYGGTGLGLIICKQLVEMMNGQIYVDSSYGHGTNFSFEISLEKQNESKRQGDRYKQFHANEAASVASQNMNILLVEDNDLNQQIVCELLESELFSVHVANNGKKAITLLEKSLKRNNRFSLIIMDLQMPEYDGYQTTQHIRNVMGLKDIPIIAMTAHAMKDVKNKCLETGMNDYIAKPVHPQTLFSCVKKWLKINDENLHFKALEDQRLKKPGYHTQIRTLLPGFDTQAGLERSGGNTSLYQKLLIGFFTKNRDLLKKIECCLNQKQFQDVQTLIHEVKGESGNLGAVSLYHSALTFWDALKDRDIQHIEFSFTRFSETFNDAMAVIDQYNQPKKKKNIQVKQKNNISIFQMKDSITKMKKLINEDYAKALDYLDEFTEIIMNNGINEINQLFIDHLESFNKQEALNYLDSILVNSFSEIT